MLQLLLLVVNGSKQPWLSDLGFQTLNVDWTCRGIVGQRQGAIGAGRFGHRRPGIRTQKGVLDFCLEKYCQTNKSSPTEFRTWLMDMYDPKALMDEFSASRGKAGR